MSLVKSFLGPCSLDFSFLNYSMLPPILVNCPRSCSLAKLHSTWLDSKNNSENIIMERMNG